MAKARRSHPDQIGFDFATPRAASAPASLAGLERQICEQVGVILNSDSRPRELIAAEMSILLGEDVSRAMLDAYSSPAREMHKVPMSRFFALVAVTERHDVLDLLLRQIGAAVLVGEEIYTAQLGHIDRKMAELKEQRARIVGRAPLIRGGK